MNAMSTHTFKRGDKVVIINCKFSGSFFVEGVATVVRPVADVDEQYAVRFHEYHETVERFVDPDAQENPQAFVDKLNNVETRR